MLSTVRRVAAVSKGVPVRAFSNRTNLHHDDHFKHSSAADHGSHKFNKESEATKISDSTFKAHVSSAWSIGDAPNGGYLMAIAINAARKCVNFQDPLSVTAYYLAKAVEGKEMDISVEVLSNSNSTSTVQVSCSQEGVLRSRYLGTFGDLKKLKGLTHTKMTAPNLPPIKDCIDANALLRKVMGDKLRIANEIEFRLPKESPFAHTVMKGKQGNDAAFDCWMTFGDSKKPSLRSLAFFCDAAPPPVLNITTSNWVPTLEYTVHFWSRPQHTDDCTFKHEGKSWVRGRFYTHHVVNGMLYTDGELWSADGQTLLATSRQFARVLTPR